MARAKNCNSLSWLKNILVLFQSPRQSSAVMLPCCYAMESRPALMQTCKSFVPRIAIPFFFTGLEKVHFHKRFLHSQLQYGSGVENGWRSRQDATDRLAAVIFLCCMTLVTPEKATCNFNTKVNGSKCIAELFCHLSGFNTTVSHYYCYIYKKSRGTSCCQPRSGCSLYKNYNSL